MRIAISNDGKGRRQSFEAEVESSDVSFEGFYMLEVRGYGETEEEAIKNLKEKLKEVIAKCEEDHEK